MRQWILTALLIGAALPATALQFGPANPAQLKGLDEIALVVNDESITRQQLANEVARERRALPKGLNIPEQALQQQLVERVIMTHILDQLRQRFKVQADDTEISQAIVGIAQQNGLSVPQLLKRVRRDTGLDERAYRAQLADNIAQDKLKQGLIGRNINITPADIDAQVAQIARQNNAVLELQDLLIPTPSGDAETRGEKIKAQMRDLSAALNAANGDLQQVAQAMPNARLANLGRVSLAQIPPRFANAVATLPVGQILNEPVIDSDGMHFLRVVKRDSQHSMVIPEANVEHILLRAEGNADFAAQKIIIDEIYNALQQGADFHALAAKYSQDPGSAARGGVLGWMGADQVVPEFAQVMLNVPLNTYSKPFPSPYGWHILRVKQRRALDRSDDIMRARIRESLYNKYLEDAWQQRLMQLRQQAYVEYR